MNDKFYKVPVSVYTLMFNGVIYFGTIAKKKKKEEKNCKLLKFEDFLLIIQHV